MPTVRSRAAGARIRGRLRLWLLLLPVLPAAVQAQQLLDRVVARVGTSAITLTDVRAAAALGLLDAPGAGPRAGGAKDSPDAATVQRMIERRLALAEVARFPPPDPPAPAIDLELAKLKARVGSGLEALLRDTGLDEVRLREMARDNLRIQSYLEQRFGATVQVSDEEARRYFDAHPAEFVRDGMPLPFEAVEVAARRGASDERLRASVAQWMSDLRARAEVVVLPAVP